MDRIIELVAEAFGRKSEQVLKKGRKNNMARDMAIYLSKVYSGERGIDIARRFVMGLGSAITMRHKVALEKLKNRKNLDRKISLIRRRIMNF